MVQSNKQLDNYKILKPIQDETNNIDLQCLDLLDVSEVKMKLDENNNTAKAFSCSLTPIIPSGCHQSKPDISLTLLLSCSEVSWIFHGIYNIVYYIIKY